MFEFILIFTSYMSSMILEDEEEIIVEQEDEN